MKFLGLIPKIMTLCQYYFSNSYTKRKYLNLFIHQSKTRGCHKNTNFAVVELRESRLLICTRFNEQISDE